MVLSPFPEQRRMLDVVSAKVASGSSSATFIRSGQRSGKTSLLAMMAKYLGERSPVVMDCTSAQAQAIASAIKEGHECDPICVAYEEVIEKLRGLAPRLVLMDSCLFHLYARSVFDHFSNVAHVVAVSSRGKYDVHWVDVPRFSYDSWEMNPTLSKDDVLRMSLRATDVIDFYG